MRLVYSSIYPSAYSLLYYSAYYLAYPAPRDCPPLADTHFPPRGDGPLGRVGGRGGEGSERTFLSIFPTLPPYYYITYYFLTIDNTPFLYTYK